MTRRPVPTFADRALGLICSPLYRQGVDRCGLSSRVAGVIAVVTLALLMGHPLDLAVAGFLYDPSRQRFLATVNPAIGMLRDNGLVAITTCAGFVIAAVVNRLRRRSSQATSGRAIFFLLSTLLLAPGLVVNVILKEHWHRPRPVHLTEFGGKQTYVDWWNPGGSCDHNCSFVSGEASSAAWMFAPAMLAPPQWRVAALAGAAIFTAVISFARMAAGGHFLTDVLFAIMLTLIVIWTMHGVIFRWRRDAAVTE
jgi:PAP2 (acid phosphatase) superfamily protein